MIHNIRFTLLFLISVAFLSCEKEEPGQNTAEVVAETCGGMVLQLKDSEAGETWINGFGNREIYQHAVITSSIDSDKVQEGDILNLDFKLVEFMKGSLCYIGGLPSTSIEAWNVSVSD